MKIKYGYLAIGTGLTTMLAGLMLKDHCEKCGSALFGFGIAGILGGAFSLMKDEGTILPKHISLPMCNKTSEME